MNKVLIFLKFPGLGDAQIVLTNIHNISKENGAPLTVLAKKTTGIETVFKHDPHVNEVINLG